VNNTGPAEDITGKITANPNSVFFGQRCTISWETNDPAGAKFRVSTGLDEEKLVTRGEQSGEIEIPWITDLKVYEFRLYAASRPDMAIDSMKARREIRPRSNSGEHWHVVLSQFVAAVIPICLKSTERRELFRNSESHGLHATPAHFYEPIPDTQSFPETLWS